jgi:oligopeptide/dipeptide ABC transporter ATP-binding protein
MVFELLDRGHAALLSADPSSAYSWPSARESRVRPGETLCYVWQRAGADKEQSLSSVLLSLRNLRTSFFTSEGEVRAVDGVSFDIADGATLGLVGESGCGKSVTALSIIRLLDKGVGRIVGGEILYRGRDLLGIAEDEMRRIRGNEISMVFQEPMTSLNPVLTVGDQIAETVRLHQGAGRRAARERAVEMLRLVKMPEPQKRVRLYPHELSGGQRQRVMIAMALACAPKLLIADEPTTALDVTIQAQILALIDELKDQLGMAVLLITHDLGLVAERADEVAVMYAGKIVERAKPDTIFTRPSHPYTAGLLASMPDGTAPKTRIEAIPGMVPSPLDWPAGCRFRDRCGRAERSCGEAVPLLLERAPGHSVACFKAA